MGDIFGKIYCLFEDLFGSELAEYMWGNSSPEQTENMFGTIGFFMLIISLLVAIVFYYIVNHPQLNSLLGWGIFVLANSVINFCIAFGILVSDYFNSSMFSIDQTTNEQTTLNIDYSNFIAFGLTNFLISIVAIFLISLIIKWKSVNCPTTPF